jgi:hypothetical protein
MYYNRRQKYGVPPKERVTIMRQLLITITVVLAVMFSARAD